MRCDVVFDITIGRSRSPGAMGVRRAGQVAGWGGEVAGSGGDSHVDNEKW